jgi:hypothetical protein
MTDDELALQRYLDEELNRLQPRPVPSEAVYGRARAIRHTRRAWAAGTVAAAAVVGTALPSLGLIGPRHIAPAGGTTVTVDAPHADKKGGYVFSGSAEGKRWTIKAAPGGCPSEGRYTVVCSGRPGDDPADFASAGSAGSTTTYEVFFGSKTTRIGVALSDGEQVSLLPGVVQGNLVALLEVPPKLGITRVDAYAVDGSPIAYSIPFQADGMAHFAMWYQSGQVPTQAEASGTITGTTQSGKPASVEVRIGPFGICYTVAPRPAPGAIPTTNCQSLTAPSDDIPSRFPDWVAVGGRVNERVAYVDFMLSTGTIRAQSVRIGGYAFAVGFADFGFQSLGEVDYDGAGYVVPAQIAAKH